MRDALLSMAGLDALIAELAQEHTVIGPTVRDGAVVLAPIQRLADLPIGVGDEQERAYYRLRRRDDQAVFGFSAPAAGWKAVLFPSDELIMQGEAEDAGVRRPLALFGVRSCDLHAIAVHDRVLLGRAFVDVRYARRRQGAVVVAVACTEAGGTCFCASTGTGPRPDAGFDLCLTELLDGEHRFLAVGATATGQRLLARLGPDRTRSATDADHAQAHHAISACATRMGRTLNTQGLRDLLYDNAEHPRWDQVADRCLACTNCTLVCPTCFCTGIEDTSSLAGPPQRRRVWDSCFTTDFAYLHGGSVRTSTAARYRQWITHKLAAWSDQFGTVGCVGCGRCITWCPAGIDLTEEAAALRATARPPRSRPEQAASA